MSYAERQGSGSHQMRLHGNDFNASLLRLSWLLPLTLFSWFPVHGLEFEASGIINKDIDTMFPKVWKKRLDKGRIPPGSTMPSPEVSYEFQVYVRDCRWRIQIKPINADASNGLQVLDAGSDGIDTYIVAGKGSSIGQRMDSAPTNTSTVAQIISGPVLFEALPGSVIWLAFCSGCYFDSVQTNRIVPVHLAMVPGVVQPKYFRRRATWENLSRQLPVPGTLQYYADEVIHTRADGQVSISKQPPPYSNGYVMAAYNVITATNYLSYRLPVEFKFQTFERNYPNPKDAADTKLTCQWQGRLIHLSGMNPLLDSEFIPPLSRPVPVADRRFAPTGVPLVGYVTNIWPGKENVRTSETFRISKTVGAPLGKKPAASRNSGVFGVLFVLVSSAVAVSLWVRLRPGERSQGK